MKKSLIKVTVFIFTFLVALVVVGKIMNKDHNNMTMEVSEASFPVITMGKDGFAYNRLFGYKEDMNTSFQREVITVLGENRDAEFIVDTYGNDVTGISIEVRSMDGSRLIENTSVTSYEQVGTKIQGTLALKDLIEADTEYSLTIVLETEEQAIHYYTRVIWSQNLYVNEKLAFAKDFHEKLYDKTAAKELTKYLETNGLLEDNSSFHKVNIHSSFKQITWGDLSVQEIGEPVYQLTEIAEQTASLLVDYVVATESENDTVYYQVQEHYRLRHTTDRMYLLDYERTMTQIPDVNNMYANDKILLGITATDIPMKESADGNVVVFEVAKQLFSYNITNNKLAVVFSFYENEDLDVREMNAQHDIKILDVDEGGNVQFAVYGYMNRGRHEGEVGIQIYFFDSMLNTIEELIYIPYDKTYAVLKTEMEQLLYMNREQEVYLALDNKVYEIDLVERIYQELVDIAGDGSIQVSSNHKIIVWQDDTNNSWCKHLNVKNLSNDLETQISVADGEVIRALGFMGEDIIYGVARQDEIVVENSGRVFFPMYKVCISNAEGELLKEYAQTDIYITDCAVVDNQITLERVLKKENGEYQKSTADQIMNNIETDIGKNVVVAADIDVYERYVQIKTRSAIDTKTIKVLNPKEVVFEGGRELVLDTENAKERYYVYGPYGVDAIYSNPAKAVNLAYDIAGIVVNDNGERIWMKGNRVTRNQIMAIKAASVTEEKNSLVVCLETMLGFEGIIRNAEYLLGLGQTVMGILEENLPDMQILDLTGCELDAVLHYVDQDIPVLALLENGEAVLVTGFNEYQVVIFEPSTGRLYKESMTKAAERFEANGNCFITYVR